MEIRVSTNFAAVQRQLDQLQADIAEKTLRSAVNKTMAQAQTQMVRAIVSDYAVTAAQVREKLALRKAFSASGPHGIQATLEAKYKTGRRTGLNLIRFVEKKVTLAEGRRRAKAGTQSELRFKFKKAGGMKTIKGAFIGNKGRTVFMREGKSRLPIKAVSMIDVPQMFMAWKPRNKVFDFIKAKFPAVFDHEAGYFIRKFNSR